MKGILKNHLLAMLVWMRYVGDKGMKAPITTPSRNSGDCR